MAEAAGLTPLPPGTCLLHVGPHKTGTTALQSAFDRSRRVQRRHRVHYAGRGTAPFAAAQAVVGDTAMRGDAAPRTADWQELVDEVRSHRRRLVVVSNEFFADAGPEQAMRIVADLAPLEVHVVVTLRSLDRIMPSQWQQYVQNGARAGWPRWLKGMLVRAPYERPTPSFWRRHRHDALVTRWAEAVGRDHVTVVVLDESDPRALPATFEALTGLPDETLVPQASRTNRSLTYGETELVRVFNGIFRRRGWPDEAYRRFVRAGAVPEMKRRRPRPDETRVTLPAWARAALVPRSHEIVDGLRDLGVRVVGDLDDLLVAAPTDAELAADADGPRAVVPPTAAARAVAGAIGGSGLMDEGAAVDEVLARATPGQLARAWARSVVRRRR